MNAVVAAWLADIAGAPHLGPAFGRPWCSNARGALEQVATDGCELRAAPNPAGQVERDPHDWAALVAAFEPTKASTAFDVSALAAWLDTLSGRPHEVVRWTTSGLYGAPPHYGARQPGTGEGPAVMISLFVARLVGVAEWAGQLGASRVRLTATSYVCNVEVGPKRTVPSKRGAPGIRIELEGGPDELATLTWLMAPST